MRTLKINSLRDTYVTQSVKCPTSAQVMISWSLRAWSLPGILCLLFCPSPARTLSLSQK
ncbi:Hypothetical predicted protein [Lynx pardinus]|uniref:Uncharacterized protein n=1 Tax=Lynx pardinus TaxID=191816 RepID=A0A485NAH4_LYNPA|nr:Hypothetical predicted protein [Lynx pardinus]